MNHSTARAQRLLREHHTRAVEPTGAVCYPAKTPEAASYWAHTGVCPSCARRALAAGSCAYCGATPGDHRD